MFFGAFLAILYVATGRASFPLVGARPLRRRRVLHRDARRRTSTTACWPGSTPSTAPLYIQQGHLPARQRPLRAGRRRPARRRLRPVDHQRLRSSGRRERLDLRRDHRRDRPRRRDRAAARLRDVHRPRSEDRDARARLLLEAAGDRARVHDRDAGLRDRRRRHRRDPADRRDAAVRGLRRLVGGDELRAAGAAAAGVGSGTTAGPAARRAAVLGRLRRPAGFACGGRGWSRAVSPSLRAGALRRGVQRARCGYRRGPRCRSGARPPGRRPRSRVRPPRRGARRAHRACRERRGTRGAPCARGRSAPRRRCGAGGGPGRTRRRRVRAAPAASRSRSGPGARRRSVAPGVRIRRGGELDVVEGDDAHEGQRSAGPGSSHGVAALRSPRSRRRVVAARRRDGGRRCRALSRATAAPERTGLRDRVSADARRRPHGAWEGSPNCVGRRVDRDACARRRSRRR